jgi:hypothetical protein
MKVLPIVAGAVTLIAGTPAAYASPLAAGCATDVLSAPGCPPGCEAGFPDDPSDFSAADVCDPAETVPFGDVWENRPDATPPEGLMEDPDAPARANPDGLIGSAPVRPGAISDPLHRTRAEYPREATPEATPSRPGGDPTSIVQRPHAAKGTERDSVDNSGHGAMRGGPPGRPRSAGLPPGPAPGVSRSAGVSPQEERRPELPQIVPGPSGSAPARSKPTTLAPTGPLRAGHRSWAATVGAAVVAEAGLLWLVVGLILRRRGRSRSKR